MIFDTTTANGKLAPKHCVGDVPPRVNGLQGVCVWEEHCVECGQPRCFSVCQKFSRGFDGKCARFRYGIVPQNSGVWVSFKEWGKLEGVYSGVLVKSRLCAVLSAIEKCVSSAARTLNRAMSFIPGRIGAITVWRRFRNWALVPFASNRKTQFTLSCHCWASKDIELTVTVFQDAREIFLSRAELKFGWNEFNFSLPPVAKGARVLLFPVKESDADVFFAQLVLTVPEETTADKEKKLAPAVGAAKFVKCLAWDLDNTMWNGILAEDGAENLTLREESVALVKLLDKRGILNTVCSKNDYDAAWAQLEKFGISEYFVFPEINWLPKSGNLEHIAKSVNINIDTFAFIDDSAFERGEVRAHLPMVRIYKENELEEIARDPAFNPPVSEESSQRRMSYLKEMARQKVARKFDGDYDGFLRSCEIRLELSALGNEKVKTRCWELVQRSNQLNLTARRYSQDEFDLLLKRDGMQAYAIRCEDKFGDYGIVGFVAIATVADEIQVVEFVVSCRVAKKKCEQSVLLTLADNAFKNGKKRVTAELIKTGRNGALIEAFEQMPFKMTEDDGKVAYILVADDFDLSGYYCHKTIFTS